MQKNRIINLLLLVNSKAHYKQQREHWLIAHCPFAPFLHSKGIDNNPSFAISYKPSEKSRFNCFSCDSHGDLDDLILDLKHHLGNNSKDNRYCLKEAMQLIAQHEVAFDIHIKEFGEKSNVTKAIDAFHEPWLNKYPSYITSERACHYLSGRNVHQWIAQHFDIRYDSSTDRLCFPIRSFDGRLVGLHGRSIKPSSIPYLVYRYQGKFNPMIWLNEHSIDFDKPVLVVESVFDLTSVMRVYTNSICGLTASLNAQKINRLKDALELVTLFDYGKAGDQARKKMRKHLIRAHMVQLVPTEAQGDPGNMTVTELVALLNSKLPLAKF